MSEKNFFESMYENADKENLSSIPWATLSANTDLTEYLATQEHVVDKRALIIGCGLGDDARVLVEHGYDVDAMDISPSAIALAKERYTDAKINFYVADIYAMPMESVGAYDFVYEGLTLQSLPRVDRPQIIATIASRVAPHGEILVYAHMQEDSDNFGGPPWPLYKHEFDLFEKHGLRLISEKSEAESMPIAPYRCCRIYAMV